MKFPVLASLILFVLILSRAIKRQRRQHEKTENDFWARESKANTVRRKPLDNLEYIKIPFDRLPTQLMAENETVADCLRILETLSSQQIVNLTGYTNTDLKLEYGAANINTLSEYDQNYTLLVRTLQKWADILWDGGCRAEAAAIMEFAMETRTDISFTYYKLAEFYASKGDTHRIEELINTAQSLRSANKNTIVRTLRESYL